MDNNIPTTNFPLIIKKNIEDIELTYNDKEVLRKFQYVVKEYIIKSNARGLLIYQGTGSGKSILAASISDYYRKHDPKRKIIILLSKSLQSNFEENIKKYMRRNPDNYSAEKSKDFIDKTLESRYKFVSLNASNMYTQMSKVRKTSEEAEFEKQMGNFNEKLESHSSSENFLENSLLIIDESHNLSTAVKNGSKNAVKLYNKIMNTKNIKLILLTATPIVNTPFELVPAFNMLKGYIHGKKTLFPENREDFDNFFISKEKEVDIKNKDKFQNRIFGLVSYYGDIYFDKDIKEGFPRQNDMIVENIHMSPFQFSRYSEVRDIEKKEDASKYKKLTYSEMFSLKDDSKSSSSYRIRSRQVSNFLIPDYALEFKNSRTTVTKYLHKIKKEDLKDLDKYSPKFKKIIENVDLYPNKLGVVYSEFVSGEGLNLFALVLEATQNYVYWRKSIQFIENDNIDEFGINKKLHTNENDEGEDEDVKNDKKSKKTKTSKKIDKKQKTYALITGDVPFAERQYIINSFNKKENINGDIISLLLLSKSGAEGISLKNVRHLHIMEPFWNYSRIEQVIARGARFQSHINLPENERNITPYIYISTYPKNYDPKFIKEKTTDETLLSESLIGKKLRDHFEKAIMEVSIDCNINYKELEESVKKKIKCRTCVPNNQELFTADIYKDLRSVNPCKEISENSIETKEIKVTVDEKDEIFYYSKVGNNIQIFKYNEEIGGYVPMEKNNPLYSEITKKILKFN